MTSTSVQVMSRSFSKGSKVGQQLCCIAN